jgi:hypothetical protein
MEWEILLTEQVEEFLDDLYVTCSWRGTSRGSGSIGTGRRFLRRSSSTPRI